MRKKTKKKTSKRKIVAIKTAIIAVLILFVVSCGVLITYLVWYINSNEKFNLTNIVIENAKKYTNEEIITASKLQLGQNVWKVSSTTVQDNINQLPYVEQSKVSKKLPNSIVISLIERESAFLAYDKDSKKYIKLSKKGDILQICDTSNEKTEDERLVFGINFDNDIKANDKIANVEIEKLHIYFTYLEAYTSAGITNEITSVTFEQDNITITLDYILDVVATFSDIQRESQYKVSLLKEILSTVNGKTGTIDLTLKKPTYSIVKK